MNKRIDKMTPVELKILRGNLSLNDMSTIVGTHYLAIQRWERGNSIIPSQIASKIKTIMKGKCYE